MIGVGELLILVLSLIVPVLAVGVIIFFLFRLTQLASAILDALKRVEALLRQRGP